MPKFRGDSDDWLDNQGTRSKRRAGLSTQKKPVARAIDLPAEEANAVVAEVFQSQCRVKMDLEGLDLLCSYRRAGVVGKSQSEIRERTPVAVGDRVLAKSTGGATGVIEGICLRKNSLSRPAPGREAGNIHHTLAANIDLLVIVASAHEPRFSAGLVDRFLVAAESENIPTVIAVTKVDLLKEAESGSAYPCPWEIYPQLGYTVIELSSKTGMGIEKLLQEIQDKVVVFCGQSGVGKTSLLRVLLKNPSMGRVGAVNETTGKGRHTTTGAVLLGLGLGGTNRSNWIDTPGVREFGLTKISAKALAHYFPEMKGISCAQASCLHQDEPGCQARELARYLSYRRILDSLIAGPEARP